MRPEQCLAGHDWHVDRQYDESAMWECRDCGFRVHVADADHQSHRLYGLPVRAG